VDCGLEWTRPWTIVECSGLDYAPWNVAGVDHSTGVHRGLEFIIDWSGRFIEVDHGLHWTVECGSWIGVEHGLEG